MHLLNSVKTSVKRRVIFDQVRAELISQIKLPSSDFEASWYSKVYKIKKSYVARRLLNAVTERVTVLQELQVSETVSKKSKTVGVCLDPVANTTETQSGSKYVTASGNYRTFEWLLNVCNNLMMFNDAVLISIHQAMKGNSEQYSSEVIAPFAHLTQI